MRPNPPSEGSAPRQRAGENDFYDPPRAFTVISRVHSTATVARTVALLGASRESSSPARRLSPGCAKCQRAGKNDFYDPHGNLPHPLDRHGRAHRVLARRIILHANLRLPRVGLRAATRCRQCARIRRRKEARRASVRAKTTSTTLTGISRVHSTATVALTVPSLGASYYTRIFVSRASAFARLCAAANAPESAVGRKRATPACGRKRLLRPAPRFHGNLPRPLDRHGRAHRALARRITRIFVSRASAFARLRKVPACGQKRLLRPSR